MGLARSNAHRTLQTLRVCGWAEQDAATARYRASLRLFELGTLQGESLDVAGRVRPHLAALAEATGETIHLAALDGADIVYLDKFESLRSVVAYSRIGGRAPAACVAAGKALLAAHPHDAAALRARLVALAAHTPRSFVDFDTLAADLDRAAARGHAENQEEWRVGVCGLGAPVFDARGLPVVAVGMSVPSIRFGRAQAKALARRLVATARDASVGLGYRLTLGPANPTRR